MIQDIRFGLKQLLKDKAFTLAALATLALCIGANTAIFTVLNTVVLRGLPYPEPDRLVTMYNIYPGVGVTDRGANGVPDYLDRRKMTDVFSGVALIGYDGYDVGQAGSPQHMPGQYVTPSYFATLGVQPILGRTFTNEEGTIGKEHAAILSEGLWKDLYAKDPNVLGKDIRLSGVPYHIVGVMPAGFTGQGRNDARIWVPFAFTDQMMSDDARHSNNWGMVARLKPGVTIAYAQQRIDALNKQNLERFPKYRELLIAARFGTRVLGLKDEMVRDIRPTLYLLQGAVAVVLLIGCVNLANLMLVRSNVRMKELAIRFSLGAGRWRLGRQLLTESVLLALMGGAIGIAIAYGGIHLLSQLGAKDLPRGEQIHLDGEVLGFTAAIAVLTGILFGALPVLQMYRRDLNQIFRSNERGGTTGHRAVWVRTVLVVSQVSLAFVLLIGSGLLTLSFARLLNVSPGFNSDHVITAQVDLPRARYEKDPAARAFEMNVMDKLQSIPGVKAAGLTTFLPFSNNNNSSVIEIDGRPLAPGEPPPVPGWNHVNAGYFAALNIPLQRGRTISDSDTDATEKVVVIDQFLAKKYWPNGDAIGHKIRRGLEPKDPLCTIVGIVGSVKTGNLAEQNPVGQVYYSYKQFVPHGMQLVLRSERDDPQLSSAVRQAILSVDAELPIFDTKTMSDRIAASLLDRRAAMVLCLVFGALAMLLSAIGIYGVLAYAVAQRTREFGIRVALGASIRDVISMVVGQGLRMAGAGLIVGAIAAVALTRMMTAMLYDVKPTDPTVFASVAFVLGLVAISASLLPTVRALRIRPANALRYE